MIPLINSWLILFPLQSNFILTTIAFLGERSFSEQSLLLKSSGSIGITLSGKYVEFPLFKASSSIIDFGLTKNDTSAMATYNCSPSGLFSEVSSSTKIASSKSFASFGSIVIKGFPIRCSFLEIL